MLFGIGTRPTLKFRNFDGYSSDYIVSDVSPRSSWSYVAALTNIGNVYPSHRKSSIRIQTTIWNFSWGSSPHSWGWSHILPPKGLCNYATPRCILKTMSAAADLVTIYTQTNWRPTSNHWLAKSYHVNFIRRLFGIIDLKLWVHVLLMDQMLCRNRCQQRCQSADITVADVLCVSAIYIGYYMLFGHSNWWIITCGWRSGLFVLINTTIHRFYYSLPFISRQNWRTLCTRSPIHCAGAQFTHGITVEIQLIDTCTHP